MLSSPQDNPMQKFETLTVSILLAILVTLGALRLASFVVVFGEESLQMDFSAFYTAGEAANAGLSPYENHYPDIWDGICRFQHSRFLYPPLVATLFRPIAAVPYHIAKYLWMLLSLACVAASIVLAFKAIGGELGLVSRLALAFFVLFFHPLLVLLERGQVDAITLLLVTASFFLICCRRRDFAAGILLAVAVLLKLHTIYVVPFLLLRRKWRTLAGLAAAGFALLLLSLSADGPDRLIRYATVELPRIAEYGEEGPVEMRLAPNIKDTMPYKGRRAVKQGRDYPHGALRFHAPAALVATPFGAAAEAAVSSLGFHPTVSVVSVVILSSFILLFLAWEIATRFSWRPDSRNEFVYWLLILVIVLLSGPMTWVMNAVWLIPLPVFVLAEWKTSGSRARAAGLAVLSAGLLWMALPDHKSFPQPVPFDWTQDIVTSENALATVFVAIGLMLHIVDRYRLSRPLPGYGVTPL
jgi:hypothetical protein